MIAAIKFLVAHSTSIATSFRSKNEQAVERNRTVLDVSGTMGLGMMVSLLVAGSACIVLGFMLSWRSELWIWISIELLVVIAIWMFTIGQGTSHQLEGCLACLSRLAARK